jgi:pimeloyl-ACP methyl ester carboxylesterase
VLMPNRLHVPPARAGTRAAIQSAARAAAVPGLDVMLSYAAAAAFRPQRGIAWTARGNPAAADLFRQAFADVPGNSSLARAWSRCARNWPRGAQRQLLDLYPALRMPVLLLWADEDRCHPQAPAEEALELLPQGQLRVLPNTGFLMAYDDPVGLARELAAFCG